MPCPVDNQSAALEFHWCVTLALLISACISVYYLSAPRSSHIYMQSWECAAAAKRGFVRGDGAISFFRFVCAVYTLGTWPLWSIFESGAPRFCWFCPHHGPQKANSLWFFFLETLLYLLNRTSHFLLCVLVLEVEKTHEVSLAHFLQREPSLN